MMNNTSIFNLYVGSKESLQPTEEELAAFLKGSNKEGRRGPHADDLAKYRQLIEGTEAFEQNQPSDADRQDLRKRMFYGALGHTRLANRALLSAMEQYKYHLHTLASLDFITPAAFIKSAENELGRLNRKKIDDAIRMTRLEEMIAERKKVLTALRRQWADLTTELRFIALYIRDNLVRIERLCEASVVVLAELEAGKKKELIEGIKTSFKQQLKEVLSRRQVTKEDLERAKQKLDAVSTEISEFVREDVDVLTALYEAIRDHAKKNAIEIAIMLADIESTKSGSIQQNQALFQRLGQELVSLLSDFRLEPKASRIHIEAARQPIIMKKRREMLDYLLEQVRRERRSRTDRRSEQDRRKVNKSNFWGAERRIHSDRRSGKRRRDLRA